MNHPFSFIKSRAWLYFVHWSLWMFAVDEMRMKTAFTPFTLDESSAMHIHSVKCKFGLKKYTCQKCVLPDCLRCIFSIVIFCFHSAFHKFRQYVPTSLEIAAAGLGQLQVQLQLRLVEHAALGPRRKAICTPQPLFQRSLTNI